VTPVQSLGDVRSWLLNVKAGWLCQTVCFTILVIYNFSVSVLWSSHSFDWMWRVLVWNYVEVGISLLK
jgi:hypothetical protein